MAQGCLCAGAGKSTGRPGCTTPRGITTFIGIGQWKNDSGNINSIPQGTVIDQVYVEALLNNLNLTERLFILPAVKRVLHDQADDITEDLGNGQTVATGEKGVLKHTYEIIGKNATEEMYDAIRSHFCNTNGFHEFTNFGQITGTNIGDGDLRRTKIMDDSYMIKMVRAQEGVVQKIVFSFIVDETEDVAQQDHITSESIEYPTRYWYESQPVQLLIKEVESTSLTELVLKVAWIRERWENDGWTGLVTNDWNAGGGTATIKNITTGLDVAVVSSESTDEELQGVYTLTFAAQTDEDVLEIGLIKDGIYAEKIRVFCGPTS